MIYFIIFFSLPLPGLPPPPYPTNFMFFPSQKKKMTKITHTKPKAYKYKMDYILCWPTTFKYILYIKIYADFSIERL